MRATAGRPQNAIPAAIALAIFLLLSACATPSPHEAHAPGSVSTPGAATPGVSAPGLPAPASRSSDLRLHMVDNARAMLGQPYRYGGAAPGGFDCSGLVAYAAGGAGIHVPRTAKEQQSSGFPIARSELLPGDLVFMRLKRKELHVGIALGNEQFIHAPSAGGHVRIDVMGAALYARGFIGARRIIDAP